MTPNQLRFRAPGFKDFRHIPLGLCSGFKASVALFFFSFLFFFCREKSGVEIIRKVEFSQSVIFAKWNFRKVAKFRKVEFHKVGMRKKWSANLIRRVNFEFANPVEIRKGCEFEDREL